MNSKPTQTKTNNAGAELPKGIYALRRPDGSIAGYKTRWREEGPDGIPKNAAKSFSVRKFGSLKKALQAASAHRKQALQITRNGGAIARTDPTANMTIGQLFQDWCVKRGPSLSQRYAEDSVKRWDREIESRPISRIKLERLSLDPSIIARFQDELQEANLSAANQAQVLKTLRAVLRWGRRRYPKALTTELSGLFEIPSQNSRRLAYATDAYGLERLIEAALRRRTRNPILPLRDAAFIAAMGFTIAARPSEWLYSTTWGDLHENSIELQKPTNQPDLKQTGIGLKTGARAALLLPNALMRLLHYKNALVEVAGEIPENALIFQAIDEEGPIWSNQSKKKSTPKAWTYNDYKRWTARVWRPIRQTAANAPGAPKGLATMRFYDCRHTAISMALHSTLIMGPHGMNLHNLAAWAGHDVQTLQRHYSHIIARYQGSKPIELEAECSEAIARVEQEPHPN